VNFTFTFTSRQIFSGHEIENNEMGGACSIYGDSKGVFGVLVGEIWGKETSWQCEDLGFSCSVFSS
jgi:hypothetical protein